MENQEKNTNSAPQQKKRSTAYYMLFELGIEFAFIIALPLLVFIYAGKWADAKTNHHFYVIIGILLALALSCYMVYRKIVDVKNMMK